MEGIVEPGLAGVGWNFLGLYEGLFLWLFFLGVGLGRFGGEGENDLTSWILG